MSINDLFNSAQSQVPFFDGENYDYWSIQMKTLFISQDLWELVKDEYETLGMEEIKWTKLKEYNENKKDVKSSYFHLLRSQEGNLSTN